MKKEKEATAAVLMEPEVVETRVFPLPDIGDDDALLRLEACGMCGTDYELYYGHIKPRPDADGRPGYPVILGHEPVGTIEEIGPEASRLWGVEAGDRVVLGATGGLGLTGISTPPSLWGGYAEFMYVSPSARVFPMSKHVSVRAAATYNALACGFEWAVTLPGLQPGQSIVILGPGQRGLASLLAAREAGAAFVGLTGLTSDGYKLDLARELGADVVVDAEKEDPVEAIRRAIGEGVDVVVDTTPYATQPFIDALEMIRRGGTVVIAGLKGGNRLEGFSPDLLREKLATVKGAGSPADPAVRSAIELIESGKYPMERLVTRAFSLEEAAEALVTLAGKHPERKAINVIMMPHGSRVA